MFHIYIIFAGDAVYIGYTRDIVRRMREHGNPPFWAILETVGGMIVRSAEVKWIKHFSDIGVELLNINRDFSAGTLGASEETRQRLALAGRGNRNAAGNPGNPNPVCALIKTPEHKAKLTEHLKKARLLVDPETQKRGCASLRGKPSWNRGIPASEISKEKNRQKHLGRTLSAAHRAAISAGVSLARREAA